MGQLLDMLGLGMLAVLAFGIYFLIAYLFARLCWLVMPSAIDEGAGSGHRVRCGDLSCALCLRPLGRRLVQVAVVGC